MEWLNWALERTGGTPWGNGRPPKLHIELSEKQLKPGRVIIVGDIHGCYEELQDLLKLCSYKETEDNLILAGDLVNKGPESAKVLAEARRLGAHCIRGNHEDGILALLRARKFVSRMSSSYAWLSTLTDEDKEFLSHLPFTIHLPAYRVGVVHAGLVPGVKWEEQTLENLLFLEDLELNDDPTESKRFKRSTRSPNCRSWAAYWDGPLHVFFGHAADRGLQEERFATGLDTGCVQGGELTAAILPPCCELRESEPFNAVLKQGQTRAPTLKELGATLVTVPARTTYKQPKSPKVPNLSKSATLPTSRSATVNGSQAKAEVLHMTMSSMSRSASVPLKPTLR